MSGPSLLEQAEAAEREGQRERVLELLLGLWSSCRDVALAELIERLADQLAASRPGFGSLLPVSARGWLARAADADAVDLGVLLPSLHEANSAEGRRRLGQLQRFPPDPRIGMRLVAIVATPPFTNNRTRPFWTELHRQLPMHADPRMLAPVEQARGFSERLQTEMGERFDRLIDASLIAIRDALARAEPLTPEQRARLEALAGRLAAPRDHDLEQLLANIYAEPHELAHRYVYADHLLALGDPRGEFIALQLADHRGELGPAGRKRMHALQREHAGVWLRDIAYVLASDSVVFERGFLVAARIHRTRRNVDDYLDSPLWSTVESIADAPMRLIRHPNMRALVSITCDEAIAYELVTTTENLPRIQRLSIELDVVRGAYRRGRFKSTIATHFGLPKLRVLALHYDEQPLAPLTWIWTLKAGLQLPRLELRATENRRHGQSQVDPELGVLIASLRDAGDKLREVIYEHRGLRWVLERDPASRRCVGIEVGAPARFDVEALRLGLEQVRGVVSVRIEENVLESLPPEVRALLGS